MKLVTLLILTGVLLPPALAPLAPGKDESPELAKLTEARLKAVQDAYGTLVKAHHDDTLFDPEKQYVWSKRLLEAEREGARDNEAVVAALQAHRDRMTELQTKTKKREEDNSMGAGLQRDALARLAAVPFYRAEADLWLERAKARK